MARKFLWLIAILTGLVIVAAIVWRMFAEPLIRFAFVPSADYAHSAPPPAPDYQAKASWIARPDIAGNPALFTPAGYSVAPKPAAAVFFVSPTAWLSRSGWNAPLDDADTNDRLDRFTRMQASVFNGVAEVWVPRYRQATFGAFLKPGPDAAQALGLAYTDVERAFDTFLAAQPADRPIILAGHSQGSLHLLHLLKSRRAVLGKRLVAVYAVGWAVALPEDTAVAGLPACTTPAQSGCLLSWQTYAADGELDEALKSLASVPDLSGKPIGTRPMLCVNPLTGGTGAAGADRNAGMLADEALVAHKVGASCNPRGLLLISPTPRDAGPYVLPGGNFHVYDYALFWANIRADVEARLSAHADEHPGPPETATKVAAKAADKVPA